MKWYIEKIIVPFISQRVPKIRKELAIFDCFKGQTTPCILCPEKVAYWISSSWQAPKLAINGFQKAGILHAVNYVTDAHAHALTDNK